MTCSILALIFLITAIAVGFFAALSIGSCSTLMSDPILSDEPSKVDDISKLFEPTPNGDQSILCLRQLLRLLSTASHRADCNHSLLTFVGLDKVGDYVPVTAKSVGIPTSPQHAAYGSTPFLLS